MANRTSTGGKDTAASSFKLIKASGIYLFIDGQQNNAER
jgi:hypothetical protein